MEFLNHPPDFIRRHWGSWGVFVLALWSAILSLLAASHLLLFSSSTAYLTQQNVNLMWTILGANIVLCLGFALGSYGLSTRKNWGRLLFLGLITIWSAINLIILLDSLLNEPAIDHVLNSLRFIVAIIVPLWYLNLPHIKLLFKTKEPL
ncbi:hypothetical protein QUF64_15745 [Anaerolineales bacterium HSG6]|nr:hypothetical protein [Anaerolineales bacterium HSG6]MDM8529871.1 hypothetical protein [Anaerolineales bacterium HSG25]